MKKLIPLCLAALLLLSAVGCGSRQGVSSSSEEPSSSSEEPAAQAITIDRLSVELSRTGTDTDPAAAEQLAALLQKELADGGVTVNRITVTFGTSYSATAEALSQGGVQLAFLPATDLILSGGDAVPLLAAAEPALSNDSTEPADWNGDGHATAVASGLCAGSRALLCAAPTEYGKNLANRVSAGKTLSWTELDHARWGVLDQSSDGGYRCTDLWLADHYGGSEIPDLSDVTTYDSYEDLLRAAAAGKIDVFPLRADARMDYAAAWTLEKTRTDAGGIGGFGREASIWNDVTVIGVTERLYSFAAAVTPRDEAVNSETFRTALETALLNIGRTRPELLDTLGAAYFAPVSSSDFNGLRRLLAMGR